MALSVHAQFQTGWVTFFPMKDAFDQCLYRPQLEVAREVALDYLIDLETFALYPALKEEWKVVSNLNVGIVEAIKLKQPVLVTGFIARRLGEAKASQKAGAIRTVHAMLNEAKAMRGKGHPPPGHSTIWGAPPGPAPLPPHASGGFWGIFPLLPRGRRHQNLGHVR